MLVAHRLAKNLRHLVDERRGTVGGVRRAGMGVQEAVDYTRDIFRKVDSVVAPGGGWAGRRVLEVGPGDSLGTGLWCLASGAASYTAIDRFRVAFDAGFESRVFAGIRSLTGLAQAAETSIDYRNDLRIEDAPSVLGAESCDVIFSNAVLEHVSDVRGSLEAMRDLLAPGGVMFHDVDLRSHQTFESHPLQFLEYPAWLWTLMSSHNGEPNRLRMPGYVEILARLGFVDISCETVRVFPADAVAAVRPRLARQFRAHSVDELVPAVFRFRCRKAPLAGGVR